VISAIITTRNDAPRLTATLATLASAAIDGLVRELIVADSGSTDQTLELAEEAGARVVAGIGDRALEEACQSARQAWLLILPAGARLQIGWEAAVRGHMRRHPAAGGWFRLSRAEPGLGARLDELWAEGAAQWLGRLRAEQGLLIAARRWDGPKVRAYPLEARILIGGETPPPLD